MQEQTKINILLAEYNTLRAEVLAARANVAQGVGIAVPVLMGLLALGSSESLKDHAVTSECGLLD